MPEISLFVDESGESGTESKYYLLTFVFSIVFLFSSSHY